MLIKQKTNRIALPNTEIQTVKGTTKIELYNPNTRIKKVYRDENTFQSAVLQNYMRDYGVFDANLYRSDTFRSRPVWASLVGGLFLFRDAITVGSQYMPSGNKMVGNGAYGRTNNGTPTELGSYNSVESSASASAITQVYDFTTSQANGDINCVSLTSFDGGLIGYGNASGSMLASGNRLPFNNSQSSRTSLSSMQIYYNGYVYTFPNSVTSGNMVISKKKVAAIYGSVFDEITTNITISTSGMSGASNWNLAGAYALDDTIFDCGNGIFRFLPFENAWGYSTAAPGANIYFFEFDANTDTLSVGHFINSSDVTITYTDVVSQSHGAMFSGDYCLAQNKLFKVSTSALIMTTQHLISFGYDSEARVYGLAPDQLLGYSYNDSGAWYLLDAVNKTEYPINAKNSFDMNERASLSLGNIRGGYKNPLYLATINNLDNTVTKTAAQTMKVTYTLTEAE